MVNTDRDPYPIWFQGNDDQKLEKTNSWKKNVFSKIASYLSLGFHKGCPSFRRILQPSKLENI
jgi:hypothetical protein